MLVTLVHDVAELSRLLEQITEHRSALVGEIRHLRRLVLNHDSDVQRLQGVIDALQRELEQRRQALQEIERMNEERKAHAWLWGKILGGLAAVLFLAWGQDRFLGLATLIENGVLGRTGGCVVGIVFTLVAIGLCVWINGYSWWREDFKRLEVPPAVMGGVITWRIHCYRSTIVFAVALLLLCMGWYDHLDINARFGGTSNARGSRLVDVVEIDGWRVGDGGSITMRRGRDGKPNVNLDAVAPNGHHVRELRDRVNSGR